MFYACVQLCHCFGWHCYTFRFYVCVCFSTLCYFTTVSGGIVARLGSFIQNHLCETCSLLRVTLLHVQVSLFIIEQRSCQMNPRNGRGRELRDGRTTLSLFRMAVQPGQLNTISHSINSSLSSMHRFRLDMNCRTQQTSIACMYILYSC